MSGGTAERVGEPTLADHVAHLRYLSDQADTWKFHSEFGPLSVQSLATYRTAFPEAAVAYDAEQAVRRNHLASLVQQRTVETPDTALVK